MKEFKRILFYFDAIKIVDDLFYNKDIAVYFKERTIFKINNFETSFRTHQPQMMFDLNFSTATYYHQKITLKKSKLKNKHFSIINKCLNARASHNCKYCSNKSNFN